MCFLGFGDLVCFLIDLCSCVDYLWYFWVVNCYGELVMMIRVWGLRIIWFFLKLKVCKILNLLKWFESYI